MKQFLLIFAVALAAPAFSQQNPATPSQQPTQASPHQPGKIHTPEERAKSISNRMEKQLSINADQKKKVYDLALLRAQKMDELKSKYNDDKSKIKPEMKSIKTAFESNLKEILTPDQYGKWEEMQAKKRPQGQPAPAKK